VNERGTWIGLGLGVSIIAFGLAGAVRSTQRLELLDLLRWMAGAAVVHDLVVVPAALLAGTVLRRVVPSWAWPTVRWALVTAAVLALLAWPFVREYGGRASVPSHLPRDYSAGLLAYVGAVSGTAVAALVVVGVRRRGGSHG
jgi:hypothetical protein